MTVTSGEQVEVIGRLRAVVFDCDGVLVDSEPAHARATSEHLASLGTPIDPALFDRLIGMRVRDQMTIVGDLTGHDPTELFAGRERRFWDLLHHEFPAMAGAAAGVRRLCDAGFAVGVATSGTREYVDHVLTMLGVRELISATTCGDDVRQPKPDPECYLRTAAELGIAASLCVAVEDTELGARSAAAAGMHVLGLDRRGEGIPSAHQRFEDLPSLVDHLLP